jgi:hypothetical protein
MLAVTLLWARHTKDHLFFSIFNDPAHLAFSVVFFFAAAFMFVGLFTRTATAVTSAGLLLWHFYSIRIFGRPVGSTEYIIYLFVGLTFTDCGRSLSVDRYRAIRLARTRGLPIPTEVGSVWGLRIICWHVTMMYFWGAYDKSDIQWLAGERMERYWINYYGTSDSLRSPWVSIVAKLSAVGVVALEYALAIGLWFRIGRRYLFLPGALMHLGMYAFLPAYHISWHMWMAYLAFVPADQVHNFLEEQFGHPVPARSVAGNSPKTTVLNQAEADASARADVRHGLGSSQSVM